MGERVDDEMVADLINAVSDSVVSYEWGSGHKRRAVQQATDTVVARLAALRARVARLEGALRVYADDNNWLPEADGRRVVLDCEGPFGGEVARAALAGREEGV